MKYLEESINQVQLTDWKNYFSKYSDILQKIDVFLSQRETQNEVIFPEKKNIFNAFLLTQYSNVKIVIIGQDPYHNESQANGLAFSVNNDITLPPSLINIFKELNSDLGIIHKNGDLSSWAKQGVFLLNTILTVEKNKPLSHQKIGWEDFTDNIISELSKTQELVFMLWGKNAQEKARLIQNKQSHLILTAPHPSPLSVYRGFWNCKHFSKANDWLLAKGKEEIKW